MLSMHFVLSFCVVFALSCLQTVAGEETCREVVQRVDVCVRKGLFVSDYDFVVPKNLKDMQTFCSSGRQYMVCTKSLNRCLNGFQRQLFTVLMGNLRRLLRDYCTPKGKEVFLRHNKCVTETGLAPVRNLMEKITINLNYVATNVSSESAIQWTCCGYFKVYEEMPKVLKNICSPLKIEPESVEFYLTMFKRTVSDAIDLACGHYASVAVCKDRLPEAMAVFDKMLSADGRVEPQKTSLLVPLLEIGRKLDA